MGAEGVVNRLRLRVGCRLRPLNLFTASDSMIDPPDI